jgi:hypothetical protein
MTELHDLSALAATPASHTDRFALPTAAHRFCVAPMMDWTESP